MTASRDLQPDQTPALWENHVSVYETVFEPLSLALTEPAFRKLGLSAGQSVLDVAAGTGGAALGLARLGCRVTAVDAAAGMVERIAARAAEAGVAIDARVLDASSLDFDDASFDAAVSAFGIILLPDATGALAEMRRVVKPGGSVGVITWTQPERYELAAELGAAIRDIWPERPPAPLPAQLRFRQAEDFGNLFLDAGFPKPRIEIVAAELSAPSARWLADRIGFAPGMDAMMAGLAERRAIVLDRFIERLETRFGKGQVRLGAVAFAGVAKAM